MRLRVRAWLVVIGLSCVSQSGRAQYHGEVDLSAAVGTRGAHGGLLGANLEASLCPEQRACAFSLGGFMQAGFASSDQAADSRVFAALGPTLSLRGNDALAWKLAVDVGGWAGGRDEGLDAGYYLGVRGFLGLPLSGAAAIGVHLGAGLYGGSRHWLALQPGIALLWSTEVTP